MVQLPRATSGRVILLIVGVVAVLAVVSLSSMAVPYWLVPAGVVLFLCTFLVADVDPKVLEISGDGETSTIKFVLSGRGELAMPRSAISKARVTTHRSSASSGSGTSTSYGVALHKSDGGVLTLTQVGGRRDRAEATADAINALLEAVPSNDEREEDLASAATDRLHESDRVSLEVEQNEGSYREGAAGVLRATWPLAAKPAAVLTLPCGLGGMATMVLGMLATRGATPAHAAAVVGALLLLSALQHIRKRGLTQAVIVDDAYLTLRKGRGENVIDEKRIPLLAVNAVDVAWTGPLMLRVDEANEEIRGLSEKVELKGGVNLFTLPSFIRGVLAIARQSIQIETGALRFSERLDLEIVLGAEIAKRTRRSLGEL